MKQTSNKITRRKVITQYTFIYEKIFTVCVYVSNWMIQTLFCYVNNKNNDDDDGNNDINFSSSRIMFVERKIVVFWHV